MGLLWWALIAFILAIIAGVLGLQKTANALTSVAKILFFIFIAIFIILLIFAFVHV